MKNILFLLFLPVFAFGQGGGLTTPMLTPTGAVKSFQPNITVTSSLTTNPETSLLGAVKDTIRANTLIPNRPYRFEMYCIVNVPVLAVLPSLTLRVKLAGSTVAMVNASSLLGSSLTNAGLRIRGLILATSTSTQVTLTEIVQPNGNIIGLSNSNSTFYSTMSANMTSNQVLDITAQWSGLLANGAAIQSVLYYRPDF